MAPEVVPPAVREVVVGVEVRKARILGPVVQVAEPQRRRPDPGKAHQHILYVFLSCGYEGQPPLGVYAAHSPRFPFGEKRPRKPHPLPERPLPAERHERPASPDPWFRAPNRSDSLLPLAP